MQPKKLLIGAAVCFTLSGVAASADQVTIASWGGSYQAAQSKALFKPVAEAFGHHDQGGVLQGHWPGAHQGGSPVRAVGHHRYRIPGAAPAAVPRTFSFHLIIPDCCINRGTLL